MSTQAEQFESQPVTEINDSFDSSQSSWQDSLRQDLYSDMSLFQSKGASAELPKLDLVIAGVGDEGLAAAYKKGGSDAQSRGVLESAKPSASNPEASFDGRSDHLKKSGMQHEPSLDRGNATVFTPANGEADIHGRTKVTLYHHGDNIYSESTTYQDGRTVSKDYDAEGKQTQRTTVWPGGKSLTQYPGIDTTADTMKEAYEQEGAAGLKKEIDKVLAKSNGDWSKVDRMLDELKQRGIETYMDGNNLRVNDANVLAFWSSDSIVGTKPAAASPADKVSAPPADKAPAAGNPVDALPWIWSSKVNDGIKKANQ